MIYHALLERKLTTSRRDFSVRWLKMSSNYRCEHPSAYSLTAFRRLHDRLREAEQDDLADLAIAIAFDRPHAWSDAS